MKKTVYKTIRAFLFLTFIVLLPSFVLAQDDDTGATLRWKNVPGAVGYKIEIRDARGTIIHRETLTDAIVTLNLPYGSYQGRVAVLNKFKKPQKWGSWFIFNIKRSLKPVFSSLSHRQFSPEDGETEIRVRGDNFMEGCSLSLKSRSAVIRADILPGRKNNELTFRFNPSSAPGGTYDLIITNPGDNSISVSGALQITAVPQFKDISPSSIRDTVEKQTVTITGKRLMKNVAITLKKGDDIIRPMEVVHHSLNEVSFTIAPAQMKRGSYDIIIANPGDNRETVKNALRISAQLGLTLAVGGFYSYPLPEWNNFLNGSFTGGEFYAGYQPQFLSDVTFIKYMGLEVRFIYTQYGSTQSSLPDMTIMSFGSGIFFNIPVTGLLSFALHAGSGAAISSLEGSSSSTDPLFYTGLSVRLTPGRYFFVESGAEYHHLLYLGKPLKSIYPFLRVGLRF
ncbi:MAG: hypothetical protein CVV44_14825 [Spirochaetae bacterium HGW-Spirochaetae-1]|jgi:hypothetical protein|nr:MAG: hypothetical protein CVV44_14825 [Spirochaetae bacterium HGW-Spirochaetae-1]